MTSDPLTTLIGHPSPRIAAQRSGPSGETLRDDGRSAPRTFGQGADFASIFVGRVRAQPIAPNHMVGKDEGKAGIQDHNKGTAERQMTSPADDDAKVADFDLDADVQGEADIIRREAEDVVPNDTPSRPMTVDPIRLFQPMSAASRSMPPDEKTIAQHPDLPERPQIKPVDADRDDPGRAHVVPALGFSAAEAAGAEVRQDAMPRAKTGHKTMQQPSLARAPQLERPSANPAGSLPQDTVVAEQPDRLSSETVPPPVRDRIAAPEIRAGRNAPWFVPVQAKTVNSPPEPPEKGPEVSENASGFDDHPGAHPDRSGIGFDHVSPAGQVPRVTMDEGAVQVSPTQATGPQMATARRLTEFARAVSVAPGALTPDRHGHDEKLPPALAGTSPEGHPQVADLKRKPLIERGAANATVPAAKMADRLVLSARPRMNDAGTKDGPTAGALMTSATNPTPPVFPAQPSREGASSAPGSLGNSRTIARPTLPPDTSGKDAPTGNITDDPLLRAAEVKVATSGLVREPRAEGGRHYNSAAMSADTGHTQLSKVARDQTPRAGQLMAEIDTSARIRAGVGETLAQANPREAVSKSDNTAQDVVGRITRERWGGDRTDTFSAPRVPSSTPLSVITAESQSVLRQPDTGGRMKPPAAPAMQPDRAVMTGSVPPVSTASAPTAPPVPAISPSPSEASGHAATRRDARTEAVAYRDRTQAPIAPDQKPTVSQNIAADTVPSTAKRPEGPPAFALDDRAPEPLREGGEIRADMVRELGATHPMAPAQKHTTMPLNDLGARVSEQMAQSARNLPGGPVEITLNPEELGRVRMHLTAVDGALTLVVAAEKPETLELMRRNIDQLAQEYRDMGYDALDFSFGQDSGGRDQQAEPPPHGQKVGDEYPDLQATRNPPMLRTAATGIDIRI